MLYEKKPQDFYISPRDRETNHSGSYNFDEMNNIKFDGIDTRTNS